ncbi:unnamed protein product [Paramecium primaurelia]|uniref:Uncharacterized protein n=1 Tax=Paramecium primaurelia TaxID=5886 RepID=A0A8S1QH56_PARPR|nr:unnamed protein product [Paramecium primaurelia]
MKTDQLCIGFNLFFQYQFQNINTANSKQNLEKTEKIIEQWNKLTDEDKMYWQQKEEDLKSEIKNKNNSKPNLYFNQEQKDIEDIEKNIQLMKFDEAKQNYKKRIYERNQQNEANMADDSKVKKITNTQKQKNNKNNNQRKKQNNQDENCVEEIKRGKNSKFRQSKRGGKRRI